MAILTDDTVAPYVEALALPALADAGALAAAPVAGGNLNYAWRCGDGSTSVFVKQAPDYIKCLGEDFKLTSARMAVEVGALRALHGVDNARAPAILHHDVERCARRGVARFLGAASADASRAAATALIIWWSARGHDVDNWRSARGDAAATTWIFS